MPTYVYKFVETGETVEIQQSFSDDTLTEALHPASGTTMAVKKVFTPVGVTFKGGGFYKTDSRSGSGTSSKVSPSGASSDSAGGSNSEASTGSSSNDSSGTATASPTATAPTTSTPATSTPATSKPATPAASSSS